MIKTSSFRNLPVATVLAFAAGLVSCQIRHAPPSHAADAFAGRAGTLVMIDCASGAVSDFRPEVSAERSAPCSTFKIWNTLVGLENGIVFSADEPFYKWDGTTRKISQWNRDLTLREAFQVSCVPAFRNLARKIGPERMQASIDQVGYGNHDISAGVDQFWLPTPGRRTILISPMEQAQLLCKLVVGRTPFSARSVATLKTIMKVRTTGRGVLYGKTGSGSDRAGETTQGWYVGFVESGGRTIAFACLAKGDKIQGKDARAIVETTLEGQGLL
jgi:beta-lactamase class D